jgi:GNAT superfamily N-acetyltransferase
VRKYSIEKSDHGKLSDLKKLYLKQLPAPRDGMWETFVMMADHYAITSAEKTIGYFVINSEQQILQFYVEGTYDSSDIFQQIIDEMKPPGAVAMTSEPEFLSHCLDHQKSVTVNALMYHFEKDTPIAGANFPDGYEFRTVQESELSTAVNFAHETLGADQGWLSMYYGDLIKRKELFGLWDGKTLIATGERRVSETQKPYADVGMIVSTTHRGQGLATMILQKLLNLCGEKGLSAICSTEKDNVGAQKAIAKAGFIDHHRIVEFKFN